MTSRDLYPEVLCTTVTAIWGGHKFGDHNRGFLAIKKGGQVRRSEKGAWLNFHHSERYFKFPSSLLRLLRKITVEEALWS